MSSKPSLADKINMTHTLELLRIKAAHMGWKLPTLTPLTEDSLQALQKHFLEQETRYRLYTDILSQSPPPPQWVEQALTFPIESEWIEHLDTRLSIDRGWRAIFAKLKHQTPQSAHSLFPRLPLLITESNVTPLLQQYKDIHKQHTSFFNRLKNKFLPTQTPSWEETKITLTTFRMGYIPAVIGQLHSSPFWLGMYPCTQELYTAVMGYNPSFFNHPHQPVESVSWFQAIVFCNQLSLFEGYQPTYQYPETKQFDDPIFKSIQWNPHANGYRLPTKEEWLYAARNETNLQYSGSNDIDEVGWHMGNSNGSPQPVGGKKANRWGIYDLSGNVSEWVWDQQHSQAIHLGGSWLQAPVTLSHFHDLSPPSESHYARGFRLARNHFNKTPSP